MLSPFYKSQNRDFTIVNSNTMDVLSSFEFKFDMIFADPPYFLSNGGKSISSGKIVSVDKGDWDKAESLEHIDSFNRKWLTLCYEKLSDDGSIWITGTFHNIFSIGHLLSDVGFKIINVVTWQKQNPPVNIYDTHLQYSSELIIWAKKKEGRAYINTEWIKDSNRNQMLSDVWKLPSVRMWEKSCGKHPTQKPLALLSRIIGISTKPNAWILDPFMGSGTTGIAACLFNRRFCGIEQDATFCELAARRRQEIEDVCLYDKYREKINKELKNQTVQEYSSIMSEDDIYMIKDLPF